MNPSVYLPLQTFSFDYSYWSHDNFKEMPDGELVGTNKQYATQRMVYDDLGAGVLKNAYEGFNSTLFAYGQTGAGKSYSMVGYSVNKGIIPIVCKEMFMKVEKAADDPTLDYQVTVTMLEIYNERVRDLLNPKINPPGGLKIRSKPGVGVYVEDLTPVAVATYDEVSTRMDEGTANRTVASTKMNATSSRAHTVFGIAFSTITHDLENDVDAEMAARMNLVDLAGSERAESTGATGDRLKEGSAINASLSALGNVISALADMSMGKKKVFVPYRNSALTRLLQDALGGNSKTVMIAALSPADVNYDETLGTLRYADRAKKIKNKVVKMENPTDKIIRMLKEENARLMKMLSGQGIDVGAQLAAAGAAGGGGGTSDPAEIEALKQKLMAENEAKLAAQMEENEKMIAEMKKSWSEKLADSRGIVTNQMGETGATSMRSADKNIPYIVNLHEDTMLTEKVVYSFKEGITRIGRKTASEKQDVILSGLSISREHAIVENEEDGKKISLTPIEESKTYINGQLIKEKTELHQDDRVLFGNNYVFRFEHPEEESKDDYEKPPMDEAWNMAMNEYREANGLNNQSADDSIKALQKEEAKKREDLEMKLRDMELKMKEQKANAKKDLEAAMAKGGMSASEMASYQDVSIHSCTQTHARLCITAIKHWALSTHMQIDDLCIIRGLPFSDLTMCLPL